MAALALKSVLGLMSAPVCSFWSWDWRGWGNLGETLCKAEYQNPRMPAQRHMHILNLIMFTDIPLYQESHMANSNLNWIGRIFFPFGDHSLEGGSEYLLSNNVIYYAKEIIRRIHILNLVMKVNKCGLLVPSVYTEVCRRSMICEFLT